MVWVIIIMTGVLTGADPPVTDAAASMPADQERILNLGDQEVERLFTMLGHPRFSLRDEATSRLCKIHARRLAELVARYHGEQGYETKRRLRLVIEHVFYREQMAGEVGFLGIQCQAVSGIIDPSTGKEIEGVKALKVLPGFAAVASGLQDNDLIVDFDGKSISRIFKNPPTPEGVKEDRITLPGRLGLSDPKIEAFTKEVKKLEPGTSISMRVLRPAETTKELAGVIAETPVNTLAGITFTIITGRLAAHSVTPDSPAFAFGLRSHDIILSVNGQAAPGTSAKNVIEEALKAARPGEKLILTVKRNMLTTVPVTVTVCGRPVDMMNPLDLMVARARFAEWWRRQGGELDFHDTRPQALSSPGSSVSAKVALPEISVIP